MHRKSARASTDTVRLLRILPRHRTHQLYSRTDWAYLEDWCRRLTSSFSDVYVFTIPLYLPKLEADGKWRVVSMQTAFEM